MKITCPTRPSLSCFALAITLASLMPAAAATLPESPAALSPDKLFAHVVSLDDAMFGAFNSCDIPKLESLIDPAVEFYHDKDGISRSRAKFIDAVKKNVCGKFTRKLVPGTLEVYPLGTEGAIYSGTHQFCQKGAARCEGQGKFMTIWVNKGGEWKATRMISYDHRAAP